MARLPLRDPGNRSLQHVLVVLVTFAALTLILGFNLRPETSIPAGVSVGEVSPQDIEAPRTLEVVNDRATKDAREHAAAAVSTVFVYDRGIPAEVGRAIDETFNKLKSLQLLDATERARKEAATLRSLPIKLSVDSARTILQVNVANMDALRKNVRMAVDQVMAEKILDTQLPQARKSVADILDDKARIVPPLLPAVKELAQNALKPNFRDNYEETIKRRQEAMNQVEPIKTLISKGQSIVRKGDLITQDQIAILEAFGLQKHSQNIFALLGTALFVCLAIFVVGVYLAQQESPLLVESRLMWLLVMLVVAGCAMARGGTQVSPYFAPVATTSLLIAILLDNRLALLVTAILSLCVGLMTGQFAPCAVVMVTGLVAVLSVTHVTRRADLIIASLVVWLVNVLAVLVFSLWSGEDIATLTKNTFFFGSLAGLTASVVAVGALPFLEALFNVTTHIKLLDLSNPSEPLLQRLMVEAPGTYHHSMIVANLAESAARSIDADGLLSKVGAFYHDIGKMKAANFFVENQLGQENPHDRLTPTLSAHIIISHVKDGMEMARQGRLPQIIADFIDMHHGDRLVSYFYHKALQRGEPAAESDYRYHGRRPRTRETAIVMMADTIEAKARLLAKPNQENLEKMVRESIKNIMSDGQLDDSDLSLRDIQVITRAFVKTLMGIYHSRIEYPPMPPSLEEPDGKPTGPASEGPRVVETT